MKRYIFLLCILFAINSFAEDNRITVANQAYIDANYDEAIQGYNEVLNSGMESSGLYYNLGNSYYKIGNLPRAIINYERALLLNPNDKDTKYNLEMCNSQITDKLDNVGEFFLSAWFKRFMNSNKSDNWATISIICFIISLTSLSIFLLSRSRSIKQLFFYLSILSIVISILTFNFSSNQKSLLTNRNNAIIFEASVTVKSSPSVEGTELFILHEGTKVEILESVSNWNRIQLSDGNVGWAPAQTMEII